MTNDRGDESLAATSTELTGPWRVIAADEELRRQFSAPEFDDTTWPECVVPGLWRDCDGLSDVDEVLYRTGFSAEEPARGRRAWLALDGLCYQGDIWLDGGYLGDTEGYFTPHTFEITEALRQRDDHVLAVEATCRTPSDLTAKRNITGVLQHWDNLDPALNPGGLWRRVRLEETGPIRIEALRVVVAEADAERAILQFHARLDAVATHTVAVHTLVDPAADERGFGASARHDDEHVLAEGENQIEWRVAIESPDLWWPAGLGAQPMYDIRVDVELAGELSHTRKRRLGLRSMELRNWIASVNGERIFLKGTNLGPLGADLSAQTADDHDRVLRAVADAGLNLIRLHGHVAPPEFYRAADAAGVLLWQDFPLQWGYARGIKKQAERQSEAMVDLLAHHPSIVIWCGHNEPVPLNARPGHRDDAEPTNRFLRKGLWQQERPSWNRTVLDRAVKRTIQRCDPSRPVIAHSGVLPHPPQLDGTDGHHYFGWFQGNVDGLRDLAARIPRMVRFVSEFGAQAVPEWMDQAHETLEGPQWSNQVDWDELADRTGLHTDVAHQRVPPDDFGSFDDWATATRSYQAEVIRRQVETLRLLKYRPTGGFCQFHLVDVMPAISCSVFDHEWNPKPAVAALTAACADLLAVADPLPSSIAPGVEQRQTVHIVSDLRTDLDAVLEIELTSASGSRSWTFDGTLSADSVTRIGEIAWTLPRAAGQVELTLVVTAGSHRSTNAYRTRVVEPA